jgi:glycosyltransferase involved in cell wall biosynthesis
MKKVLRIMGVRGIPAAHGGFETFAERLALYLAERNWLVTVYCQEEGTGNAFEDHWCGVRRVHIPVDRPGPVGTVIFDWKSTRHAAEEEGLVLTLGYNTAVFCSLYRARKIRNIINMDGIEWSRKKWSKAAKAWLWLNDWAGCWLADHLIADHPEIARHLNSRVEASKISTITYGADAIHAADRALLQPYGVSQEPYAIVIARCEPENSILEIVSAWSRRPRGMKLLVLGDYRNPNAYQQCVLNAASSEVVFPGAIYDRKTVAALRFFSTLYIHGHQVGGTNPSLVEALGAGNAVIAHSNPFNRWVGGEGALYFENEEKCAAILDMLLQNEQILAAMRDGSRQRHLEKFTWNDVLLRYEGLLFSWAYGIGVAAQPARTYEWNMRRREFSAASLHR